MKKRFVVGLREVARSVKVSQIKLIVFAPDIEESSAPGTKDPLLQIRTSNPRTESLDDRVAEILEGAREMSVLCVFGLNRKKLGAALGFKLRMSVVGLSYIDGESQVVPTAILTLVLQAPMTCTTKWWSTLHGAEFSSLFSAKCLKDRLKREELS